MFPRLEDRQDLRRYVEYAASDHCQVGAFEVKSSSNRRRFPRLVVGEEARVYDETGRELGLLSQVSGNGMNIEVSSLPFAQSLVPGRRMRISIIESSSRETNVVDVVVRRLEGNILGMQFVDKVAD
ncbi:MAG: hypothetical protein DMG60_09395 [Acidobacteria bacterium]|nr:MAG: hypothetical protein DMG60_09395 [Acidobacteriota bacterium]